jgi:hypothetical protein
MGSTAITLTEQEQLSLHAIAQQTGKTPEELLHEAIAQFLAQFQHTRRRALPQQAVACGKIAQNGAITMTAPSTPMLFDTDDLIDYLHRRTEAIVPY